MIYWSPTKTYQITIYVRFELQIYSIIEWNMIYVYNINFVLCWIFFSHLIYNMLVHWTCDLYVTPMWPLCDLYVASMWTLCDLYVCEDEYYMIIDWFVYLCTHDRGRDLRSMLIFNGDESSQIHYFELFLGML